MPWAKVHRTPSLLRLRLRVVYAEQPPEATSTNAAGARSARPSGVGLGPCAGTVASRTARLGRPNERQAKRAGAGEASMLPPNTVKTWTYHLNRQRRSTSTRLAYPTIAYDASSSLQWQRVLEAAPASKQIRVFY